jgi:hypothetical protein
MEVLFLNSFLEVALGFFLSLVGEISPKKKKHCCIMWLFLHVQKSLNHMGCSDAIHEWMMGPMNEKLHFIHDVLYYM